MESNWHDVENLFKVGGFGDTNKEYIIGFLKKIYNNPNAQIRVRKNYGIGIYVAEKIVRHANLHVVRRFFNDNSFGPINLLTHLFENKKYRDEIVGCLVKRNLVKVIKIDTKWNAEDVSFIVSNKIPVADSWQWVFDKIHSFETQSKELAEENMELCLRPPAKRQKAATESAQ